MSTKLRTETKPCRHGTFTYFPDDEYVGRSLALYGEYSEEEVLAMAFILNPDDLKDGDAVIEVGANIGSLTVPMAKMLRNKNGTLFAFEPHPVNAAMLRKNIKHNDLEDVVEVYEYAASDVAGVSSMPKFNELTNQNFGRIELGKGSFSVRTVKIDDLNLQKLRLLKIDAEGHELSVLRGAEKTIRKLKPIIYIENDREIYFTDTQLKGIYENKGSTLTSALVDLGYRMWWHRPPLYDPKNAAGNDRNVFGPMVSINMLCIHEDAVGDIEVTGLDEVGDLRVGPDMYEREIARYERITSRHPDDLRARLMLAHYLNCMQRSDEAMALLDENLRRNPNEIATANIKGIHQLQRGMWKDGWEGYELRYKQKHTIVFGDRPHDGVKWDGKPTDETVLLYCEQGYGDNIMFARFIPWALSLAPNLIVEMRAELCELYEISGLAPPKGLYRMGRALPKYTKYCSLPSLPHVLGVTNNDEIQCPPYMRADPLMVKEWRERDVPRIGICCAGSAFSERPFSRDIDDKLFKPLTEKYGPFMSLGQHGQFWSYTETAACLSSLDLLITVDTSVVHLAGALGVPTWLLLSLDPDWRWGLSGSKTVWYDSVRIFRQKKLMDWPSVVDEVASAFEERMLQKEAAE